MPSSHPSVPVSLKLLTSMAYVCLTLLQKPLWSMRRMATLCFVTIIVSEIEEFFYEFIINCGTTFCNSNSIWNKGVVYKFVFGWQSIVFIVTFRIELISWRWVRLVRVLWWEGGRFVWFYWNTLIGINKNIRKMSFRS